MNTQDKTLGLIGEVGRIDCALDWPDAEVQGWALVLHPHPLYAGTRDNKVVTTIARALVQKGFLVIRPNFRGVGLSAGEYDQGQGETRDMLEVIQQIQSQYPFLKDQPFVLAGFSFGSAVASHVYEHLSNQIKKLILVGTAVSRFDVRPVPEHTLVIHGELDDTVPLSDVFVWARELPLSIQVIPGADHFFHRKLTILKRLVTNYI